MKLYWLVLATMALFAAFLNGYNCGSRDGHWNGQRDAIEGRWYMGKQEAPDGLWYLVRVKYPTTHPVEIFK